MVHKSRESKMHFSQITEKSKTSFLRMEKYRFTNHRKKKILIHASRKEKMPIHASRKKV